MKSRKQIDFRFAQNWRKFLKWYDVATVNQETKEVKAVLSWDIQKRKIQEVFKVSSAGIVDWDQLWNDYAGWVLSVSAQNGRQRILWSEHKRQIETLMLGQVAELDKFQFILVFLNKGEPDTDSNRMNYWEALRAKDELEGDNNGLGGNEELDKITIVNLKRLIK
jgi:hypothetical protein